MSVGRENTNTTIVWRIFLNWATALSSLSDFVLRAPRRVLRLAGAVGAASGAVALDFSPMRCAVPSYHAPVAVPRNT